MRKVIAIVLVVLMAPSISFADQNQDLMAGEALRKKYDTILSKMKEEIDDYFF